MIFLLVAASDGAIDQDEIAVFRKIVGKVQTHKCPLFQASIAAMLTKFTEHLTASRSSSLKITTDLIQLRTLILELFPDQATAFFTSLVELGEKVASSSDGIFGFGRKISKGEAAALDLIRATLGIQ